MTNKEKYGDKLIELVVHRGGFGLKYGEPALCGEIKCEDCDFYAPNLFKCSTRRFREWLNSEYVEPPVDWSKVAVDTPILVRDSEKESWRKRHFAKYENGKVYTWLGGATSWSAERSSNVTVWKMAKLAESEEYAWRD